MRDWTRQAACRHFPELFCDSGHQKDAVHICRQHCPVLAECAAEAAGQRNVEIVVGGEAWGANGQLSERLHGFGDVKLHNPYCRKLPQLDGDEAAASAGLQQEKEA